jgi:hypothetical protein
VHRLDAERSVLFVPHDLRSFRRRLHCDLPALLSFDAVTVVDGRVVEDLKNLRMAFEQAGT